MDTKPNLYYIAEHISTKAEVNLWMIETLKMWNTFEAWTTSDSWIICRSTYRNHHYLLIGIIPVFGPVHNHWWDQWLCYIYLVQNIRCIVIHDLKDRLQHHHYPLHDDLVSPLWLMPQDFFWENSCGIFNELLGLIVPLSWWFSCLVAMKCIEFVNISSNTFREKPRTWCMVINNRSIF